MEHDRTPDPSQAHGLQPNSIVTQPLTGVEPYTYLKDVLEQLPRTTNREVEQLTPLKWKQTRRLAPKQAA